MSDALSTAPRVAVVGCGHWGRNLARVHAQLGSLFAVYDVDALVRDAIAEQHGVRALDSLEAALASEVDGIVIAAPAAQHHALASAALDAGKHVFVEKPLALTIADATDLCERALRSDRILMVGHLLRYHPVFRRLQEIVANGDLGQVRYLYSTRLNLGRFRSEEDILWSFAPHDISMVLALVGDEPTGVEAFGGAYLHRDIADVTTTHLSFAGGQRAHVFVSWLHPFKEQKLVIVGSDGMAVFDDGEDWDRKLQLWHHKVEWRNGAPAPVRAEPTTVAVEPGEPLVAECQHFLDCVARKEQPLTDGAEGLRVLRVLDAAARSMREPGATSTRPAAPAGAQVHESAYVDDDAEVGAGTKIWHFSHVMTGARVGRDCTIGQNVVISPGVVVGDRCKIQNNVSVYEGVTLEDGVFCGPSCVFTNVTTPRAEVDRREEFRSTRVGRGATIGANATIVCGHDIGAWSLIAAGAVVTSDVPAHALMAGVPARRIGWVSHDGERLGDDLVCPRSGRRYAERGPDVLEELT